MATSDELQAFGAYAKNYDSALSLLVHEQDYLTGISQSPLVPVVEALAAAGAAVAIGSKIVVMTDTYDLYLKKLGTELKPPTPEQVAESTVLATKLAAAIHSAITASAILDLVTGFVSSWTAIIKV